MSRVLLQAAKLLPFLHAKVANAQMTAALTAGVLWVLDRSGVHLPTAVSGLIVFALAGALGYATPSPWASATTTTVPTAAGGSVSTTTGGP